MSIFTVKKKEINGITEKIYSFLGIPYKKVISNYEYKKKFLFNILVSIKRYDVPLFTKIENKGDLFALSSLFDSCENDLNNKKVDIIIYIYNDFRSLQSLILNIKKLNIQHPLFIVNDASTDERIISFLENIRTQYIEDIVLLNNKEHIGFAKSVNKCLAHTVHDVIILDANTIVPQQWVSKLVAPIHIHSGTASVMPISDIMDISFLFKEESYDNLNIKLEQINAALSKMNTTNLHCILSPNVGFCMAISKKAFDAVGYFDENYTDKWVIKNDWCMRAASEGFKNTLATNFFTVCDKLSKKGCEDVWKNQKIVAETYPSYEQDLYNARCSHIFLSTSFVGELLACAAIANKIEVWFDHSWGGGAEVYTLNSFDKLKEETLCVRVQSTSLENFMVSFYYKECSRSLLVKNDSLQDLLKQLHVNLFVVNNLASYVRPLDILKLISRLKEELQTKVSYRTHDYQSICPNIIMIDNSNTYCNCSDREQCKRCFSSITQSQIKVESIENWQNTWEYFFNNTADEIIVFSKSSKVIMGRIYPESISKITLVPHIVHPLPKVSIPLHSKLNIGVLGTIIHHKGSDIILKMSKIKKYKNISITVIGELYKKNSRIKVLGKYERKNLPKIIEKEQIDIIFISSICPETFSYTTSEAIMMDIPVACFNIGAPAERVKEYKKGLVIEKIDANEALDKIVSFVEKSR